MRIIQIGQGKLHVPADKTERLYIYNGLDACITSELCDTLGQQIKDYNLEVPYKFSLEQRPALIGMMRRGILIDVVARDNLIKFHEIEAEKFKAILNKFTQAVGNVDLNVNSPTQCKNFFYNLMGLPEQKKWDSKTRTMKVTTDRDALESLRFHFYAEPIINVALKIREVNKRIGWLKSKLTKDGRFTFTITPGGTETGRTSSSKSAFGLGNNIQNIENEHNPARDHLALRRLFIADKHEYGLATALRRAKIISKRGMKLGNADLAQAESNIVSRLARDKNYMRAHDIGDPHTLVAGMVWPELNYTGDLATDKQLAGANYYRTFSYRDMAKRGQHLSNYKGQPPMMADSLKIPVSIARDFQKTYFARFPGIPRWHLRVKNQIQSTGMLVTALGRRRFFTGDLDSEELLKEAIAQEPQSVCSDILKLGMERAYNEIRKGHLPIQFLQEGHDSLLYQFPEGEDEYVSKAMIEIMTIPFDCHGVECCIGVDVQVGYTWHDMVDWNKGSEQKRPKETGLLDRYLSAL